jgi:spermidine/putrescine transport system substrate-binding protein
MSNKPTFEELLAQAPRRHVTRRDLLRRAGIGAGALSVSAWMAACGIGSEAERSSGSEEDGLTTTEKNGELNFANWPAYIDKKKGESPTLLQFEEETDISVTYTENINDNASFYAKIRESLANEEPTGYDIIVLTDWMINKMVNFGYLEELDHSMLPLFEENAGDIYKDPTYDPDNAHSVPWQSGITGLAYNEDLTGRPVTSINDLFSEEFAGKVGMFLEMRDTMNLTMLGEGIKPEDATLEDAQAIQEKLLQQVEDGIVRQYYGNDYVGPLANGDLAVCIAWSGDVIGKTLGANSPIKFVVPDEGGMLWVDNMAIPQGAENPIDAHEMMNFVYDPKIAAQMTAWINYISPVPEAKDLLLESKDAYSRSVAKSPLVFPTPEMESNLYNYTNLSPEEEKEWNQLFDEVIQT